jgi:hypothetical protein
MPGFRTLRAAGAVAAAVLLSAGLAAAAEYRENMPEVLGDGDGRAWDEVERAPAGPSAAEIAGAFRAAYTQAGQPRLAVFWNRELTAQLSQWAASGRLLLARATRPDAQRNDGRGGNADGDGSASLSWQRNQGQQRSGSSMGALADAEFEAGFTAPMLNAGARLVDRATIMRVTESNTRRGAGHDRASDAQIVETEALKGFADYVAEITMLPDADAPGDRAFRVRVKRIPDGLIAASLIARGERSAAADRARWVATSGGYKKVTGAHVVSAEELGRAVALETMQALSRAWP